MLAMLLLGRAADYVLCDTDPESVASLREAAMRTGLIGRTRIVEGDPIRCLRFWAIGSALGGRIGP
jgi:hypothetical protein